MRPSLTPPLALSAAAGERLSSFSRLCPAAPLPLTSPPTRAYLILQSMVASRGEGSQEAAAAPPEGKRQAPVRPGRERRTRGKGSAGSCLACSSSPRVPRGAGQGRVRLPRRLRRGWPESRSFTSPARRDGGRKSSTSLPASLLPLSVPAAEKRLLRHLVESRKLYGGWRNLFPGPWPGLERRTDA